MIPEGRTEEVCPLVSNFYYKRGKIEVKKIRMWLQMGETLKVLGRLSSSLKSLVDADKMCEELLKGEEGGERLEEEDVFTMVLVKKELAAVEYYYRNFKDS